MRFVKVDYNNPLHLECIWKLSNRNNFHKDDIRCCLYGDVSLMANKYKIPLSSKLYKLIKVQGLRSMYNKDKKYKGILVCVGKKVVGFILYYIRLNYTEVDLLFILVDKTVRNKGYGRGLIMELHRILSNTKPVIIVRVDDVLLQSYYKKLGYVLLDGLDSNDPKTKILKTEHLRNPSRQVKMFYIYK